MIYWIPALATLLVLIAYLMRRTSAGDNLLARRIRPTYLDEEAGARAARAKTRLFAVEDRAFLEARPGYQPIWSRYLKSQRTEATYLYLAQFQAEFRAAMHEAHQAAVREDAGFGLGLVTLSLRFHMLYAILWLQCSSAGWVLQPLALGQLADLVAAPRPAETAGSQVTAA